MRIACFALAATLAAVSTPAAAAIHIEMTGVVVSGSDNGYALPGFEGPFGSEPYGYNLATGATYGTPTGKAFTLKITVDPSRGEFFQDTIGTAYFGNDADSPAVAVFTLNGFTYELGSYADTNSSSTVEKLRYGNGDFIAGNLTSTRSRPSGPGPFVEFDGALRFAVGSTQGTFSTLDFSEPLYLTDFGVSIGFLDVTLRNTDQGDGGTGFGGSPGVIIAPPRQAALELRFDTLSVRQDPPTPGVVPEPSTWAMMILGFGAAGVAIRRRARGETAAAV